MFNNTYSPVGSPIKKNIAENTSPISSPLKHPRSEFGTGLTSNFNPSSQILGQPVEIIQGKLSPKLNLLIFTYRQAVLGFGRQTTTELQECLFL
jgi:hypothetical protein